MEELITPEEFKIMKDDLFSRILKGVLFIHPTDTIYGIGCSANLSDSVKKVRKIKQRHDLPFSVIAPSKDWIRENCIVDSKAEKWIEKLPGPYTLILKTKAHCVAPEVSLGKDSLGIRIPAHWFAKTVEEIGFPIVTTSANISGSSFMTSMENLDSQIKKHMSFIIYEGEKQGRPSTLVDLTGKKPEIKHR